MYTYISFIIIAHHVKYHQPWANIIYHHVLLRVIMIYHVRNIINPYIIMTCDIAIYITIHQHLSSLKP